MKWTAAAMSSMGLFLLVFAQQDDLSEWLSAPAQGVGEAVHARQPNGKRKVFDGRDYRGRITAAGPGWIELGIGWEGEPGRGKKHDPKKPVQLSTLGTKPGGNPDGEGEKLTHLASDLRVGDTVNIEVHFDKDGDEWTTEIRILRRPGGKIPPMANDPFVGTDSAFHLRAQAEQDWEEKGTPIPKKYLNPEGRAPWTNPPYPPVAPMPRLAKAK